MLLSHQFVSRQLRFDLKQTNKKKLEKKKKKNIERKKYHNRLTFSLKKTPICNPQQSH